MYRGQLGYARAMVLWTNYCAKLKQERLSLTNPDATTRSLLVKWRIKEFDGGRSNLLLLIQNKLWSAQPDRKCIWNHGMGWMFLNHHLPSQEFDVWKRIGGNMEKYVTNM